MGDRGNICMTDGDNNIYFYTHWSGSDLFEILQSALKRGEPRWDDASYLARIVFCEMIKEDVDGLTGYGISSSICDNEHPIFTVNSTKQIVGIEGVSDVCWSFEEFIALPADPR